MRKGIMLVTPACGYCKMARQQINYKHPELKNFEYIDITEDNGPELNGLVKELKSSGLIRGVPATLLIEKEGGRNNILALIRGYDMKGIEAVIEALNEEEENNTQLEIPFE